MKPYHLTLASVLLIAIAVLALPEMALAWSEPFCDNDEIPVVTDEGEYTESRTELSATITNAPGATKYKYAIGTSPGGNGTKNWTDTNDNPIVCDGLNLVNGETYYFSVHYLKGPPDNCWSGSNIDEAGFSDGITVDCPYDPIVFYPPPSQQVWHEEPYPGYYWEPIFCDCLGVTLTCATPDVTIRYTTDGSIPSESNPQSRIYDPEGAVVVDPAQTVKAVAYLDGQPPGPVEVGYYHWDHSCDPPTYQYRKDVLITAPPIEGLCMGAIYADDTYPEPKNIRIEWLGTGTFGVKRILGEQETPLGLTNESFLVDNFDFVPGADYSYAVAYVSGESMPPGEYKTWEPDDPPELTITRYYWEQGDWQYIDVTPMEVIASENQVVDSRLDTRYVEDKFVNYQFKDAIYRGGLFVGHRAQPDESGVARSFLKFSGLQPPANDKIWGISANARFMRSFASGMTTDVACLFLTDDSWDSQTMVWDPTPEETQKQGKTAPPEIDVDDAREIVTVGAGAVLAHNWCNWPGGAVAQEFYGDHVASAGLVSMCEGELCDGWAYFAKKEYNVDLGPRLYYGYGDAPVFPLAVFLDPPTVQGGNTVHGTVILNAPAPVGGTWVAVSGDDCLVHVESGGTSVPGGSMTADFLLSTAIVSSDKSVTIEARSNGLSATTQLEITP